MAAVAVTFGYVDAAGNNDAALVSPSFNVLQGHVVSTVVTAYDQLGITAEWVDGEPTWLVNLLATELSIPAGTPNGWFGS